MEERVKLLAMIGAGALLGSAATVAVLKLLPRRVKNECIREAAKSNGGTKHCNHAAVVNQGIGNPDLLADEVVSEQLTSSLA